MSCFAVYLDVSALAAPEPMHTIINALASLPTEHYLEVTHRRKPEPLFAILNQQRYQWYYQQINEHCHQLVIWPEADVMAQQHFIDAQFQNPTSK